MVYATDTNLMHLGISNVPLHCRLKDEILPEELSAGKLYILPGCREKFTAVEVSNNIAIVRYLSVFNDLIC